MELLLCHLYYAYSRIFYIKPVSYQVFLVMPYCIVPIYFWFNGFVRICLGDHGVLVCGALLMLWCGFFPVCARCWVIQCPGSSFIPGFLLFSLPVPDDVLWGLFLVGVVLVVFLFRLLYSLLGCWLVALWYFYVFGLGFFSVCILYIFLFCGWIFVIAYVRAFLSIGLLFCFFVCGGLG